MSTIHLWGAMILLFLLLLAPVTAFLCSGWSVRRRNVVDGFSEDAIRFYFRAFHAHSKDPQDDIHERFNLYYNSQFGRQRFVLPLILFAAICGLLLCWSTFSIADLLQTGTVSTGKLPLVAVVAVMGAYMWALYDEIAKWYSSDLSPNDIYWWCFRFSIAAPMGYAAQSAFTDKLSLPIVFLLGAFPTIQLMTIARRIATRKLGFADSKDREVSELQSLQCVDVPKAEQFAAEGITTILQFAYSDPIKLTIRTGLSYSYIVDCTCQALLWIYVEHDITKLRKCGLRSAFEVLDLWLDLQTSDAKARAEQVLREAAAVIGCPETSLRNIFEQVALDPYTQFLFLSWSGRSKEDFTVEQQRVFSFD
jgi:hypothetical protein